MLRYAGDNDIHGHRDDCGTNSAEIDQGGRCAFAMKPARAIFAGPVSGMVMNVGKFILNGVMLADDWDGLMTSLNCLGSRAGAIAALTGLTFGLAMLTMLVYPLVVSVTEARAELLLRPRLSGHYLTASASSGPPHLA